VRYLSNLVTLAIFTAILNGCHQNPDPVRSVRAEQVQSSQFAKHYSYAGVVHGQDDVILSFQVGGKMIDRYVKIGDKVKPDQLLASLDKHDLILTIQNLDEEVHSTESALALSESDLGRYSTLLKNGYISKSVYQQAQTKYQTDQASLGKAKSALALAERKLEYADLFADYAGIVTKVFAEVGQIVSPGQQIFQVARTDIKHILISVPEQRIQQWEHVNKITVTLWAYPERKYAAKIREIAGEADSVTRTFNIKLDVINPDMFIRLGMTANVEIDEYRPQSVITLPLTAIYYQAQTPAVWVINMKNMTVRPITVTLGEYQDNNVIVTSGLNSGQWVVTAGVNNLRPGQKVKLLEE